MTPSTLPPLPPTFPGDGEWNVVEAKPTLVGHDIWFDPQLGGWTTPDIRKPEDTEPDSILSARRFNHCIEPPRLRAIYTLSGHVIATPGNLVAVTSTVKTGKTAVIGAMIASTMRTDGEADLLGFASENPKGLAVVHFDSEQSPDDHWHCMARVLKRAHLTQPPEWFYSYCLTGLNSKQSWECVKHAINVAADTHGGIHSVLQDGIADLVSDVNDPAECNAFVAELHGEAIRYQCPIVGVIHFNPGTDKTRGHLGSQFERKAETNLRLDKGADDVTEIWSNKQRRAPIPKGSGPCFQFDKAEGMHVIVATGTRAQAKLDAKASRLRGEARAVFEKGGKAALTHKELVTLLTVAYDLKWSGAKRKLEKWASSLIVSKDVAGLWTLTA